MAAVTDKIRAARVESLNRLNTAHAKATETSSPTRQNQKQVSQSGTLRAAKSDAARVATNREAKPSKRVSPKVENPIKKTGGLRGGVPPEKNLQLQEKRKTKSVKKPERSENLRETNTCKSRPEKNHGMGTSRAFVPWCGRRG